MSKPTDPQAKALLDALNDLFEYPWQAEQGSRHVAYTLTIPVANRRRPFRYDRAIEPRFIEAQPFRTALRWREDVAARFGEYVLIRPEKTP